MIAIVMEGHYFTQQVKEISEITTYAVQLRIFIPSLVKKCLHVS